MWEAMTTNEYSHCGPLVCCQWLYELLVWMRSRRWRLDVYTRVTSISPVEVRIVAPSKFLLCNTLLIPFSNYICMSKIQLRSLRSADCVTSLLEKYLKGRMNNKCNVSLSALAKWRKKDSTQAQCTWMLQGPWTQVNTDINCIFSCLNQPPFNIMAIGKGNWWQVFSPPRCL